MNTLDKPEPAVVSADPCSADRLIAEAITEAVCEQFMDWSGYRGETAPFNLKGDIYHRVMQVFEKGIEI